MYCIFVALFKDFVICQKSYIYHDFIFFEWLGTWWMALHGKILFPSQDCVDQEVCWESSVNLITVKHGCCIHVQRLLYCLSKPATNLSGSNAKYQMRKRTCAYQGVRNVRLMENLACFVFLKHPF